MLLLVLGRGRTGSLVAEMAREHGHSVRVIGEEENKDASALTAPMLNQFDAVIDFTTPEAVVPNLRACLSNGARVVVGTTGWYEKLDEMRAICLRRNAGLVYGANFSIGVQIAYSLADDLARLAKGFRIHVSETHHAGKKDAPSGTALVLKNVLETANPGLHIEITSHREGDSIGTHVITASSGDEVIEVRHEALSRRSFAEGGVRAAEWLAGRTGCYEFREIYPHLTSL
jgi:4-hydroxy-tetrahydrodipicolinate reductase